MIIARNISKTFHPVSGNSFSLSSISFDVLPGQIVGVLGTNGSGKSTLLKILAGQLQADEGQIHFSHDSQESITESVGRYPKRLYFDQDSGKDIIPSMTLWENVFLGLLGSKSASLKIPARNTINNEIYNALKVVSLGLESRMTEQARVLSGGERQGLVLARALLYDNEAYFLDEFTSALTNELSQHLMSLLKSIVAQKTRYCFFVTHEVQLAFQYADRFLFLHNGRLLMDTSNNSPSAQEEIIKLYTQSFQEGFVR